MRRVVLLLALIICQSLSAQTEYKRLVRFHVPIGATEEVAKNIIRNHNYSISHTNDNDGVHFVYYKDNDNMSITKYFIAIGLKNGKVESVKWFLESDSYNRIISEKNAISAYFQEELKYKAKKYGDEDYYTNFNYYGQTVGVVMASQASYYSGGFVRLTFYSKKTVSNMVNEKKYNVLIYDARYLYREKKYDEAKKKFDEAFALFPDRKVDHQQLYTESLYGGGTKAFNTLITDAEVLLRKKKYDEAKKKYDIAFNIFPDKKLMYQKEYLECGGKIEMDKTMMFNTLISIARDLCLPGRYSEAKEKYDEAFKLFPDRKTEYQREYNECFKICMFENAEKMEEDKEDKYVILITDADILVNQKKYDKAKKKYDEAFKLFPDRKSSYQKEYDECVNMSIKENSDNINKFYKLIYDAGDLRKQKKYDEAKKKYDEAFEIFPDKIVSYQKEYDECVTGTETKELVNPNSQNQKQTYFDSQGEEKRQQERLQLLKQKSQEIEKQYASFYAEFEKELSESEDILERDPAFPGGLETLSKYLADNIEYPPQAKDAKVSGTVYVSFIVEKDGSISNVKCLRDIGGGCCDEAILIVKAMPRWNPGIQKGKPVRTQFNLPITFDLH